MLASVSFLYGVFPILRRLSFKSVSQNGICRPVALLVPPALDPLVRSQLRGIAQAMIATLGMLGPRRSEQASLRRPLLFQQARHVRDAGWQSAGDLRVSSKETTG